jgi:hypothetical protein
LILNAIEEV